MVTSYMCEPHLPHCYSCACEIIYTHQQSPTLSCLLRAGPLGTSTPTLYPPSPTLHPHLTRSTTTSPTLHPHLTRSTTTSPTLHPHLTRSTTTSPHPPSTPTLHHYLTSPILHPQPLPHPPSTPTPTSPTHHPNPYLTHPPPQPLPHPPSTPHPYLTHPPPPTPTSPTHPPPLPFLLEVMLINVANAGPYGLDLLPKPEPVS